MAVYRLEDDSIWFPSPEEAVAECDGLRGRGDYSPERLLAAYSSGIFPWPVAESEPITWFSPDPRFVLKAEELHIPKSLEKVLRKGAFTYTVDKAFPEVIHACASVPRPGQDGTWITEDLEKGYCELQRRICTRSRPGSAASLSGASTACRLDAASSASRCSPTPLMRASAPSRPSHGGCSPQGRRGSIARSTRIISPASGQRRSPPRVSRSSCRRDGTDGRDGEAPLSFPLGRGRRKR